VIIAYHVPVTGTVELSAELADYRLIEPEEGAALATGHRQALATGCARVACR